jgi:hypothetical protein
MAVLAESEERTMIRVEMLLNTLGDTLDEIAAALLSHGVQGVRNTVRNLNPVVRYLAPHIRVDAFYLDVMQGDRVRLTHRNGKKEETVMPEPVRQFMDAFNRGKYPELELPPEKT